MTESALRALPEGRVNGRLCPQHSAQATVSSPRYVRQAETRELEWTFAVNGALRDLLPLFAAFVSAGYLY